MLGTGGENMNMAGHDPCNNVAPSTISQSCQPLYYIYVCKNSDKVGQDFRAHKTFSAGNIHLSLGGPDFTAFSKFWDESFSTLGNTL